MAAAPPTPEELVKILAEAAYFIRATQMSFVAWYAISLWDWVTSFPREYRLIHKTPWSAIKVLYLLCRYWPIITMPFILWVFIGDHSEHMCKILYLMPESIAMWNQIFAEIVLVVRTYAFFGNSIPLLIVLLSGLAGIVAFQIYCVAAGMALLPFIDPPNGPCFPTVTHPGSPLIMIFFILPLLFDTVVTSLTVFRAFKYQHQVAGGTGSPLIKMFVREGLFYFILIAGANLVNGIFYWQPNADMSALNIPLSVMLTDILACRLILDLRERGKAGSSGSHPGAGSGAGASYSHTARRHMAKGMSANVSNGAARKVTPAELESNGAITAMDFNHELTTFNADGRQVTVLTTNGKGDGDDSMDGDEKIVPYEGGAYPSDVNLNGGNRLPPPSQGIRVKVDTYRHD
ncbi:hypothetical protein FRB96_002046 [Tulasnella sp. 330]|nr:hypothetical protein FRB96_002046 [Tulasnella sp. 330]KAG8877445.1 hypothetical protein FRB97_003406 [Tulasnella sp. 331]KAG8882898.1 hypothetical protein FRB98_003394 [Tulasnella sp. 332]